MADTTQQDEVIDAEIIEEGNISQAPRQTGNAEVLLSLENLIKGNITRIEQLQQELRVQREMLNNVFDNDQVYNQHLEQAKEALKVKNTTKQEIMKQPSVVAITNKAKSLAAEFKELTSGLSDYLMEYQRMSGVNEIEGEDGEVREIINTAKLVKRSSGKR